MKILNPKCHAILRKNEDSEPKRLRQKVVHSYGNDVDWGDGVTIELFFS